MRELGGELHVIHWLKTQPWGTHLLQLLLQHAAVILERRELSREPLLLRRHLFELILQR